MIIAMTIMGMMQPAIHEIADVTTMWHCLVPTARPMHMFRIMTKITRGNRCAAVRVGV